MLHLPVYMEISHILYKTFLLSVYIYTISYNAYKLYSQYLKMPKKILCELLSNYSVFPVSSCLPQNNDNCYAALKCYCGCDTHSVYVLTSTQDKEYQVSWFASILSIIMDKMVSTGLYYIGIWLRLRHVFLSKIN